MRYVLIVIGAMAVIFGTFTALGWANAHATAYLMIIPGSIFLATGLATLDIVQTIRQYASKDLQSGA